LILIRIFDSMLEELFKKHKTWINSAYSICGNREDAEDLVQEMYIKLHERNGNINSRFVFLTLRSIYMDQIKKNNKLFYFPETNEEEAVPEVSNKLNVLENFKWYEQQIILYSSIEGIRSFSRNSGISINTIRNVISKFKKEAICQKKGQQDSETQLKKSRSLSDSKNVRDVKIGKTFSTSYSLSTM